MSTTHNDGFPEIKEQKNIRSAVAVPNRFFGSNFHKLQKKEVMLTVV